MKKVIWGLTLIILVAAASLGVMAFRFQEVIKPNTYVGLINVGGLSKEEAAKKLRIWWESEKLRELSVRVENSSKSPLSVRLSRLGVRLDDQASVADLPMDTFPESLKRTVQSGGEEKKQFDIKFVKVEGDYKALQEYVASAIGDPRPAKVRYEAGQIIREPEVNGYAMDETRLSDVVLDALKASGEVLLPITEAPKKLTDEQLAQISDVVYEFSTKFPTSQVSRCANLKLASSKLDGVILMPGEVFSFNGTVGQRTIKAGFKLAGVYANGRHDTGIGGGICQVSTTLYNAVLMSNLKIVERTNHSMPVAYVPVGRDATVDWGTKDFKFENTSGSPIAISSEYQPGKLTFRVLGKKDPSVEVKIESEDHRSWSRGVKYVHDGTLAPGKTKVVEKGSSGHQIVTYRVVYKNGVQVDKQLLGTSRYAGGVRIIARNEKAAPAAAGTATSGGTPSPADGGDVDGIGN